MPSSQRRNAARPGRGDGRSLLRDLGPERAHVEPDLRDLARVPDEPALETLRLGFHVKLQRQHVRPQAERLVLRDRRRSETRGADRQIERVAVPVQHVVGGRLQLAEAGGLAIGRRASAARTRSPSAVPG